MKSPLRLSVKKTSASLLPLKVIAGQSTVFCRPALALWLGMMFGAAGFADDYGSLPTNDSNFKRVSAYIENVPEPDYQHASDAAVEAFHDLKFGVRIHWGVYAMLGDASWPFLKMSNEERQAYQQRYKTFNPVGFNADDWMQLFQTNGVKFFAFTTKHHDGFSMFDTQTRVKSRVNWTAPGGPQLESCDVAYSIMETPFHRDIVKEITDAAHRAGLKIDLYFSHPDWYDADFRPYAMDPVRVRSPRDFGAQTNEEARVPHPFIAPDPTPEETARMVARHRAQLTELMTHYGKIDMVCLDQWLGPKVWPELRETIKEIRKLQPDVMLRARGIGNYGDYYTPEGFIPESKENTTMPWMVIYKLAGTWVYPHNTNKFHGADWVVQNLADITAKGGNFMIGFGPDDNGKFHPRVIETLKQVGAWLKINGEAIYSTRPRPGDLWREGDNVRFTRTKDNRFIYAICLAWPGESLTLKTVRAKAGSKVTLLGSAESLPWRNDAVKGLVIQIPEAKRPSELAYAFKIEADDPAEWKSK
jgi:alpha-L-fucosidase